MSTSSLRDFAFKNIRFFSLLVNETTRRLTYQAINEKLSMNNLDNVPNSEIHSPIGRRVQPGQ